MQTRTTAPEQLFGYTVTDPNGNSIGSVDAVWVDDATSQLEFIGVKTGWLAGKTHALPMANAQISGSDRTIAVPYSEDQIKDAPSFGANDQLSPDDETSIYSYYGMDRSTAPSPTGLAGGGMGTSTTDTSYETGRSIDTTGTTGQEDINVPISEEELAVGKRQVEAGQVRLRKVVRTEHQEVPVELRREEVQVERVPAGGATDVPANAFQEQEINVPLMQEEPVVEKRAHVTGQVRVQKEATTDTQTVGGEVRREDVDVDRSVDTAGTTGRTRTTQGRTGETNPDEEGEGPIDRFGDKIEGAIGKDL